MEYKDILIFILSVITSVSEVLPYIKEVDSNGILQLIVSNIKRKGYKLIKDIQEDALQNTQELITETLSEIQENTLIDIEEHESIVKTQPPNEEQHDKFLVMKVDKPKTVTQPEPKQEEDITTRFQLLEDSINTKYNQLEINISCYYNEQFKMLENKITEQDLKIKILSRKLQN
jgi:protein-tyrosine-phosphatase